jgi:hypothetical protein
MKAFIASMVSLGILLFTLIEAASYISLNMELIQDVQPASTSIFTKTLTLGNLLLRKSTTFSTQL